MQTKLVILIAILAFALGVLAYPLIFGTSSEPIVPDVMVSTSAPDTVEIVKYIKHDAIRYVYKTVYDTLYKTETEVIIDTLYITEDVPYFKSFKAFEFDYADSRIWAWAKSPVDSFQNEVTIDWQTYFIDKQKPMLQKAKYNYFIIGGAVGLSAGLLAILFIK